MQITSHFVNLGSDGNCMSESMAAVRGYLRTLRDLEGMSQDSFGDAIGLSRRAVINWETGKTQTIKMHVLIRAIRAVHGAIDDIERLLRDDTLTEADGERLALERHALEAQIHERAAALPRDQRATLANRLREMADDLERQGL